LSPASPQWYEILIGIVSVILGCLGCCWSLWSARHNRNWMLLVIAFGLGLFVIGVVGQRPAPVSGSRAGWWEVSIKPPGIGVAFNVITGAGLLLALVGSSLVLFFERVIPDQARWRPPPWRPLEDDDSV